MPLIVGIKLENPHVLKNVSGDAGSYAVAFDNELSGKTVEKGAKIVRFILTLTWTEHQLMVRYNWAP